MEIKNKFISFAKYLACPYVLNLDAIKPYVYSVSIILVGSVPTGICKPSSNVDICILCAKEIYDKIFPEIEWNAGKYMEMDISGVKTRYYLEIIDDVIENLTKLDDLSFYLYAYAIPLDDVSGDFKRINKYIAEQQLHIKHKKHVYRSMIKRRRILSSYLDSYDDPFGRLIHAQDSMKSVLRAIAVFDNIPYDPKKHPYQTAIAGATGVFLKPCIDELMNLIPCIIKVDDKCAQDKFLKLMDNCISAIG